MVAWWWGVVEVGVTSYEAIKRQRQSKLGAWSNHFLLRGNPTMKTNSPLTYRVTNPLPNASVDWEDHGCLAMSMLSCF